MAYIDTMYLPADGEVGWGEEIRENFRDIEAFVNSLRDDIDQHELDINNIESEITDINSAITGLLATDIALDGRVEALETAIYENTPTGTILMWAGSGAVPTGWAECDGSSVTTGAPYNVLYAAIGSNYGGSGSNFNLPNFTARFPVGVGIGSGPLSAVALGSVGGEAEHVLVLSEIPPHTHNYTVPNYIFSSGSAASACTPGVGTTDCITSVSFGIDTGSPVLSGVTDSGNVGDGSGNTIAHNNTPPFLGVRFIIKL